MASTNVGCCRRGAAVLISLALLLLLVVLMTSSVDGQSSGGNATNGKSRTTAKRARPSPPSTRVTRPSAQLPTAPAVPPSRPSAVVPAAGRTSPAIKTLPAPVDDEVEEEEEEEEDNDDEIGDEFLGVTRSPPEQVVTAPMPRIPLETTFTAIGGETNSTCVMVKTGIRFTFSYVNQSSGKTERGIVDLPARNYSVDSQCGDTRQRLSLIFTPEHRIMSPSQAVDAGVAWNLTLTFVLNDTDKTYSAEQLSLRYAVATGHLPFPWSVDARMTAVLKTNALFRTPAEGHSFICMSDAGYGNFTTTAEKYQPAAPVAPPPTVSQTTNASQAAPVQLELVEFYNLQLQAFIVSAAATGSSPPVFASTVVQCKEDFISIKVPVIVGVFVLVFQVAVIVVYMTRRMLHGKARDEKRPSADYHAVQNK